MGNDMPDFFHLPVMIRGWKAGKRQIIEIDSDLVTITEKGLFSERNAGWNELKGGEKWLLQNGDRQWLGFL